MTAPHSPAPWTAHGSRITAADGTDVCDIIAPIPNDGVLFEANRHLIAMAPEMLAALKKVRDGFNRLGTDVRTIESIIDRAEGR